MLSWCVQCNFKLFNLLHIFRAGECSGVCSWQRGAKEWEGTPMALTHHIITLPTHQASHWPSPWKMPGTRPLTSALRNPMFGKCVVQAIEDTSKNVLRAWWRDEGLHRSPRRGLRHLAVCGTYHLRSCLRAGPSTPKHIRIILCGGAWAAHGN